MAITRRQSLIVCGALGSLAWCGPLGAEEKSPYRLTTFSADVTVPLGHGMMGGSWLSKSIADPLEAHGIVLLGGERPIVFVSVDWCEIRNDAYLRWQTVLAEAAGTRPECVLVSTVHQHDAPVADLTAEKLLRASECKGTVCDPLFHEKAVQAVAKAVRDALRESATADASRHSSGEGRAHRFQSSLCHVVGPGAV
jgi:hypothetical protein